MQSKNSTIILIFKTPMGVGALSDGIPSCRLKLMPKLILVGAKLDQFARDMNQAGDMADSDDVIRWRQVLDAQAPLLSKVGVEVLNASAVSTLTAYPKVDFAAAMHWQGTG